MRMENGKRVAEAVEIIQANATWAGGSGNPVATVRHTPPGGEAETLHTTTSAGAESFAWDAKHAVAGDHVFTHTITRGGAQVNSLTVTFTVPEPALNTVRIFGPSEFYSGNIAQYTCMGYFSDDSGRQVLPQWSLASPVAGVSVGQDGVLTADESSTAKTVALRAVATVGGCTATNELQVTIAAAYLSVRPTSMNVPKSAGEHVLSVQCSGVWTAESSDEWLTLVEASGEGDGILGFSAERNPDTKARKATITVRCGTLTAKLTVKQAAGDEEVRVTVAFDAQGGSATYGEHEYIAGEAYGTLPWATKAGKVFGGWWTLPNGQGVRVIASSVAAASVTRLYAFWRDATTADALDGAMDWTQGGDAEWTIDAATYKQGGSSMRSGAIGDEETTTLMTEVTGPGTLSFWWRASCEEDFDKLMLFDGLSDDEDDAVMSISGETGWVHRTYSIADSGTHVIRWVFAKDESDGEGQDCAWLDGVVWMPAFEPGEATGQSAGDHVAPSAWKAMYGIAGADIDGDSDGDGMTDWEEYVAGSNPADPGSKFTLDIKVENDEPVVQPSPYLGDQRSYVIEGKVNLTDPTWAPADYNKHRFFRAKVNLK